MDAIINPMLSRIFLSRIAIGTIDVLATIRLERDRSRSAAVETPCLVLMILGVIVHGFPFYFCIACRTIDMFTWARIEGNLAWATAVITICNIWMIPSYRVKIDQLP